jgi:hypothetical protein
MAVDMVGRDVATNRVWVDPSSRTWHREEAEISASTMLIESK